MRSMSEQQSQLNAKSMSKFEVILFVVIGLSVVVDVNGYSKSEEATLAMFRSKVGGKLTQDFMKSNAFLIRWLRTNDMNVVEAEVELKTYLEARDRAGVDNFKNEDFRSIAKIMPFRHEGVDKQGRPIIEFLFGKAVFRRIALTGKSDLAPKYYIYSLEKALRKTIEIAETTGKDIDSFYIIADLDGFNTRDHLCVSCSQITIRCVQLYGSIIESFVSKATVVNAPRVFGPVMTVVKQILRAKILQPFNIYDANKENWKKVLLEDINADQLPPRLGGTNTQFDQKKSGTKN